MSSAAYTLHLPQDAVAGDPAALERADLVRDGFSWGAFLVPPLWFWWHRHWVLGLAVLVVGVGLTLGLSVAGVRLGAVLLVAALLHVLFGFEGSSLRRFAYRRRGRSAADLVVASGMAEAEAKAFSRWLGPADETVRPAPRVSAGPGFRSSSHEPIIGLFPDLEGRRP